MESLIHRGTKDQLGAALAAAIWTTEILSSALIDFAAAFARRDEALAREALAATAELIRRDLAAQRQKFLDSGVSTGGLNAMQKRLDKSIAQARKAIEQAAKPARH